MLAALFEERVIRFRPRTVLAVLGIVLAVFAFLQIVWLARQVITWVFIAIFLALALNPLVELGQRLGIRRRGLAIGAAFLTVIGGIALFGGTLIPIVVDEVNDFVNQVPTYVQDLTEGRGRLGFLQEDYQIVDRIERAIDEGGASGVLGFSGTALAVTKGIVTIVIATITIAVLTFFMLLEGPGWIDRFFGLFSEDSQRRLRAVGRDIYRTVGGYVSGALMIALIAGVVTVILLSVLSIEYAIALGLLVAVLDLIPLAGATLATILVSTIAFLDSTPKGIIVLVFFIIYQQVENHFLYPVVYSRTVQLSPLAILIAVLIGASLAGILGALAAIPVAGSIQVVLADLMRHRRAGLIEPVDSEAQAPL